MIAAYTRKEIDHRTIKLIIGVVAIVMAPLAWYTSRTGIASISASYHEGDWAQNIFVGFLFAIAALMLSHNGSNRRQMFMSKAAAVMALGVALFPCDCGTNSQLVPHLHGVCAALMFAILAYFCYAFFWAAREKKDRHPRAKLRAGVYALCGCAIVASILVLAIDQLSGEPLKASYPRLTFYGEWVGLWAFGISWLTSSRVMPGLTDKTERFSPLKADNPPDPPKAVDGARP